MRLGYAVAILFIVLNVGPAYAGSYVAKTNDNEWTLRVLISRASLSSKSNELIKVDEAIRTGNLYKVRINAKSSMQHDGKCPDAINFDAEMPQHYHGMSTLPVVHEMNPKTCEVEVEGVFFQMPGNWTFNIDVRNGRISTRAVIPVVVEVTQ